MLKSVGNNVWVHKAIWWQKLKLSVVEHGGSLAVVHHTRDAICDSISQCRRQTSGNVYQNVGKIWCII
jgi:hypothetical protein